MNIHTLLTIPRLALLIFWLLPAALCSGQQHGNPPETSPPDPGSYAVPAEKAQQWENLRHIARKDYNVCLEHCAGEQTCTDRCEQAFQRRLKNEFHRLTD